MHKLRDALRCIDALSLWVARIASVIVAVWIPITIYDVVMRYFFRAPTEWAYELSGLLFGPFWLLAGAYVLSQGAHVNLELFYEKFSLRTRAIVDLVCYLLFFFYCGMILTGGWDHFWLAYSKNQHTSSVWHPHLAPFWLMIPVGAGLILLQGVAKYIRDIYTAVTGRKLE